MSRTTLKLLAAGVVLLCAIAYLGYASMKEGWASYHLPVDSFVGNPKYASQRVRLAGTVAQDGLVPGTGQLGVKFILLGQTQRINVDYSGVVPEMFKPGGDVIVEGRLEGATFRADVLMTKCASKYEAKDHSRKTGRPS